jgi:hypothetical protein
VAIGEQEVEDAVGPELIAEIEQRAPQVFGMVRITGSVLTTQHLHHDAERMLAVRLADRAFVLELALMHVG